MSTTAPANPTPSLTAHLSKKGRDLNAIWRWITIEELLNIPMLFLLLCGGQIITPYLHGFGIIKMWTLASWLGGISFFTINRMRIHWELWTIRFLGLFVAWSCFSGFWSEAPIGTSYSPILTSITMFMYCNYIVDRFTPANFLRILIWTVTLAMTLSIIYALFFPSVGIENVTNIGAWKGCFTQKNTCGLGCTISFVICLGLRPTNAIDRIWRSVVLLLTLVVVIKTESRESWLVMLTVTALFIGFLILRRLTPQSRVPAILALIVVVVALVLALQFYTDDLLGLLGRDKTLTGRTQIWDGVLLLISRRPWLGYGVYGVWGRAISWDIVVRAGWQVTSAHNTYLEVLLDFGIVGLLLFLPIPLISTFFTIRAIVNYDLAEYEIYIYLIISIMLVGLVTSNCASLASISLLLLAYSVTNLERVERSGFMKLGYR